MNDSKTLKAVFQEDVFQTIGDAEKVLLSTKLAGDIGVQVVCYGTHRDSSSRNKLRAKALQNAIDKFVADNWGSIKKQAAKELLDKTGMCETELQYFLYDYTGDNTKLINLFKNIKSS